MEQIKRKKGSVPISISLFDLNYCLSGTGLVFEELDHAQQCEVFHYLGVDVYSDIEQFECLHRTKFNTNNEPWFGVLFTGVERVDEEWFWTGKASLENRINRHAGSGFNVELRMMSATSNFTADICEHISKGKDRGTK